MCASSLLLFGGTVGTASAAVAAAPSADLQSRAVLPQQSDPGKILALVNEARTQAGCQPLTVDPKLTAAAQEYANDTTTSHTGSDGSTVEDRLKKAGATFNASAENIAWGSVSERTHVDGWLNSPGHAGNIKNCSFTKTGVAVAGDRIVQVFTN
ncbi:CAP domain-containing protein [Streptomyces sp. NPDC101733]|uniref:CAP domain-containing protein n=1 Tax=unclassified Streptomyces TaxID=2593676 RepID=UPI00382F899F